MFVLFWSAPTAGPLALGLVGWMGRSQVDERCDNVIIQSICRQ